MTDRAITVFVSYSHSDEVLAENLMVHLSNLRRQGVIAAWHDRQIEAGAEWAKEVDSYLDDADLILLLISADFLASDYCWGVEMRRALERHDAGKARVIPIVLRPVDWFDTPFAKLQVLPRDGTPITTWRNRDEAFINVARGIRQVIQHLDTKAISSRSKQMQRYRKELEFLVAAGQNSEISEVDRRTLDHLQTSLGLTPDEANAIEQEVLQAFVEGISSREHKRSHYRQELERLLAEDGGDLSEESHLFLDDLRGKLKLLSHETSAIEQGILTSVGEYRQTLTDLVQQQYPLSESARSRLRRLQKTLTLTDYLTTQLETRLTSAAEAKHQKKLEQYRQIFSEKIQQQYPITEEMRRILRLAQQELKLRAEDVAIVEAPIEAEIISADIREIRLAIDEQVIQDYQQVAKAIIRRMNASNLVLINSPDFQEGLLWEACLPVIGLNLRTQKVVLFLRQQEESMSVHEQLAEIARDRDAQFLMVLDVLDVPNRPIQVGTQIIWFRSEMLMQMSTAPKAELLAWLGRFITSQIDLPTLLPYKTQGKADLFFGRDRELDRLVAGMSTGGVIVGAHQSGKTSLLAKLGERLKQRGRRVGMLTLGALSSFQTFFEETLDILQIELPDQLTLESWSAALKAYSKSNECPVLLLDEVDGLTKLDAAQDYTVGKEMRALQYNRNCEFYLAGHASLREAIAVEGGPFRNFAEELTLTGLEPEASLRLIREPMKQIGFSIEDEQAGRIVQGTAGVAVLIQEFCLRLLQGCQQVTQSQLGAAEVRLVEESSGYLDVVFEYYQYAQDWCSKSVMLITAMHDQISRREIMEKLNQHQIALPIDRLDKALGFLVKFGILEQFMHNQYRILPLYLHQAIKTRDPELLLAAELERCRERYPLQAEDDSSSSQKRFSQLFQKAKDFFIN